MSSSSSVALNCDVLTPDNVMQALGPCNGTFTYNGSNTQTLKFYIQFNTDYKIVSFTYNFAGGGSLIDDDNNNDTNTDDAYFDIDMDDHSPETDQELDLTITTYDDDGDIDENYDEEIKIVVQVRNGSSWSTASTSDYDIDDSTVEFDSSDDGELFLSNHITFTDEGTYRIYVYEV